MRVLVLHDELAADARPDELDTLAQAEAVAAALDRRGHEVTIASSGLDLRALVRMVEELRPEVAFNLVESVGRSGRLAHLCAHGLELAAVPFTGAGAQALFLTNSKLLTKQVLSAHGLPTPAWQTLSGLRAGAPVPAGAWLIKAVWEHGSLGLDDDSVRVDPDTAALLAALEARLPVLGGDGFAERYVHGREFNLGLLEVDGQPRCLPNAEMRFCAAFVGRPHLVGYKAKWDPESPDYRDTVRSFEFTAADAPLLARMEEFARATWRAFGLRDYARVDFRIDAEGQPWIIDINANPCVAPDAGFAAILEQAGIAYDQAIEHIASSAARRAAPPAP
jgi:D-alanine-D-alanine ligase